MKMLQFRFMESIHDVLNFKNSVKIIFVFFLNSISYSQTTTFNFTGAPQTYTVPPCVTSLTVTVAGAKGGGPNGGNGAQINATITVTPGQVLTIIAAGTSSTIAAGYGGGGSGVNANTTANASFGGGGASGIFNGATPMIIAAGGGGTGGGTSDAFGGAGGCASGIAGVSPFGQGGGAASQTAGGIGGPGWIGSGATGSPGSLGQGGTGAIDPCFNNSPGGGGGGGYYGGGGGGSDCWATAPYGGGGGGGGSSLIPAGATCTSGANTGAGYVTITPVGGTITPTFNPVAAACQGSTLSPLPTTSNNGYNGAWSPALNNMTTTVYTFTPTTGQCASNATLTITINPGPVATFPSVSPICAGATLNPLPTISNQGFTGTWSPALNNLTTTVYTFVPTAGQCASNGTLTITVNQPATPTFSAVSAICAGNTLNPLPTVSNNGFIGSWSPAMDNTQTTLYTFTPNSGQCASNATLTITVNQPVTTTFNQISPICYGSGLITIPTTSTNGVTGTWSPSFNDTITTLYTFTPNMSGCNSQATMTVVITQLIIPSFNAIPNACVGSTLTALPTTSTNGVTGSWSPALDNTTTTTYSFSPNPGQCAASTDLTIVITQLVNPTFALVPAACAGSNISALPIISNNGISGSWSPAIDNTTTTTYTFQPAVNECAISVNLTININNPIVPTFNQINPICAGATINVLPTVSNNAINGSWSPALNNMSTTTYNFTPSAGQCAMQTTLTITVNPSPIVNAGNYPAVCVNAANVALIGTPAGGTFTGVGVSGTNFDPSAGTSTITYTYTSAQGCSNSSNSVITVNPLPTINAGADQTVCSGTPVTLSGSGGVSYVWTSNITNNQAFNAPIGTNNYTVTGTNANGCSNTDIVQVVVVPSPLAGISPSVTFGQSPLNVIFTNTSSNATNFIWTYGNGDGDNTSSMNPTSTIYENEGVYTVTLTASNGICSDVENVTITVQDKFPATVTVPNVFSPNGDGLNDIFFLKMENAIDVKVLFYNRWGELVYDLNGIDDFWNGKTQNGNDASEGVYFFKYEVTSSDKSIIEGHGNVTLIR